MIVNELYNGSGLGNQLWYYVVTRSIALDNGYDFGIMNPNKFKGHNLFEYIDFGLKVEGGSGPEGGPPISLPNNINNYYVERVIKHPTDGCIISGYDENLAKVKDCTKIDGNFQSEKYILHRKEEIKKWLKIKKEHELPQFSNKDTCVVNIRGGEYVGISELFLKKEYWQNAMNNMNNIVGKKLRFIVITDDFSVSKSMFPELEIYHFDINKDYSVIHNAKYLLMSNSSFAWFPAWTSENLEVCIAPKYWARHNVSNGFWSCGDSLTKGWLWQDKQGLISDYETCLKEKNEGVWK